MFYIFRLISFQLLGITSFLAGMMVFLLWIKQSFRFVSFIVIQRLSFIDFFWFVMWMMPDLLVLVLPFAFFLAVLMLYSRYENERVFIALKSAGCSSLFLLRPILYIGLLGGAFLCLMTLYLVPLSFQKFRQQELFLRSSFSEKAVQVGEFKKIGPFVVYARERHADGSFGGLVVFDERQAPEKIFLMGEKALVRPQEDGMEISLKQGIRQMYDKEKLSCFQFEDYTFASRRDKSSAAGHKKLYEKSLIELFQVPRTSPLARSSFFEGYQRLFAPFYFISFGLLAGIVMLYFGHATLFKRGLIALSLFMGLQLGTLIVLQMNDKFGVLAPLLALLILLAPLCVVFYERQRARHCLGEHRKA